jgi:uncharacterized membrane protein YbhN (UPF0104 family)
MKSPHQRVSGWLLLLGLALFIAIVARLDVQEIMALVVRAGPWLLLAILVRAARLLCGSLGWRALIAEGADPPSRAKCFTMYWVGHALSAVTPGDALGEVGKGALAARSIDGAVITASLVTHRILLAASGVVAGIIGSVLCLARPEIPREPVLALLVGNVIVSLGLIVIWRAIKHGATPRVASFLSRIPLLSKGVREWLVSGSHQIDRELATRSVDRTSSELRAFSWLAALRGLQAVELVVLLLPLLPGLKWWSLVLLALLSMSAIQLASFVGSWIPAKLGVLEGTQAALFASLGLDPATGVALQLLLRARTMFFVAVGLVIGWRESRGGGVAAKEPSW